MFKAGALGAMKTNVFHTVKILTIGLFAVYLKKMGIKPKVYVSAFILMLSFYSSYTCKKKNYVTVLFSYPSYYLFYSLWFAQFYVELFFLIFIFYIPIGSLLHFYA